MFFSLHKCISWHLLYAQLKTQIYGRKLTSLLLAFIGLLDYFQLDVFLLLDISSFYHNISSFVVWKLGLIIARYRKADLSLAGRTEEGPVAGRDGVIILSDSHGNRTGEDVQSKLLNPLVPIAFIKLMTV